MDRAPGARARAGGGPGAGRVPASPVRRDRASPGRGVRSPGCDPGPGPPRLPPGPPDGGPRGVPTCSRSSSSPRFTDLYRARESHRCGTRAPCSGSSRARPSAVQGRAGRSRPARLGLALAGLFLLASIGAVFPLVNLTPNIHLVLPRWAYSGAFGHYLVPGPARAPARPARPGTGPARAWGSCWPCSPSSCSCDFAKPDPAARRHRRRAWLPISSRSSSWPRALGARARGVPGATGPTSTT